MSGIHSSVALTGPDAGNRVVFGPLVPISVAKVAEVLAVHAFALMVPCPQSSVPDAHLPVE